MIRIAICDDTAEHLQKTQKETEHYLHLQDIMAQVEVFSRPRELMSAHLERPFDVCVLDVIMPEVSGMELGKILREENPSVQIIYTTTSVDYAVDAFALQAVHYLVKPFKQNDFAEAMNRALKNHQTKESAYLSVYTETGLCRIPVEAIYYCEGKGAYQYLHLDNNPTYGTLLKVRWSMLELFTNLKQYPEFVRCGANYIINVSYISQVQATSVTFKNGEELFVPKRAIAPLKAAYFAYFCEDDEV